MSQQVLDRSTLVIPPRLVGRSRARVLHWALLLVVCAAAAVGIALMVRPGVDAPRFRTAPAERRTITRTIEASGRLDVPRRFEIAAPLSARLVEVRVHSGARVRRGDVLARLDAGSTQFDARAAQAEQRAAAGRLADAEARYAAAVQTRKRMQRLVELELTQPWRLDAARSGEASAEGARDAARAERDAIAQRRAAAERVRGELTLRAPVDGIVLAAPTALGAQVSPGSGSLFTLGDTLETLRLDAFVAEADVGSLRAGQDARFNVPAFPDRSFSARVERVLIEPEQKQGAVSYPVVLVVTNSGAELLPGMTANVSIEIARSRNVLAVREAALRFTPQDADPGRPRAQVWTSEDGSHLTPVPVVPGLSDGAYTEIVATPGATLSAGDPVVIGTFARENDDRAGISLGRRP